MDSYELEDQMETLQSNMDIADTGLDHVDKGIAILKGIESDAWDEISNLETIRENLEEKREEWREELAKLEWLKAKAGKLTNMSFDEALQYVEQKS